MISDSGRLVRLVATGNVLNGFQVMSKWKHAIFYHRTLIGDSRCHKNRNLLQCYMEKFSVRVVELQLANPWKIASSEDSGIQQTVIVELTDGGTQSLWRGGPVHFIR